MGGQGPETVPEADLLDSEQLVKELEDALAAAKRDRSASSVLMIDLDQISAINDRHGRPAGDKLIRAAAEVVLEAAAAHEGIAARVAGDELCLLLPTESLEPARRIAEDVRARIDAIELRLAGLDQTLAITASVGVASYPEHAPTVEGLLTAADVAVYDAKLEGRNRTRMASPPGVREALKLQSEELDSQDLPSVPEAVDEPAGPARRSRPVALYLGALCAGMLCAGGVAVGALSSTAIPNLTLLLAPVIGGLPLLMLWIAEKQYRDRSRAIVAELHMSNDELEAANSRLFGLLDENRQLLGRMQRSYLSTITSLARAVEAKDPYTSGHPERVAELALLLARGLGIDDSELAAIRVGAIIHDIGKVGTPDQILSKPGALTAEETREIRKHPEVASRIVAELELPEAVKQMVRSHHERFDGEGYPDGLSGEEIPLAARVLSVAEALDAMTSDRPYRDAMSVDVAIAEIQDKSGTQFCPRVVAALTESLVQSRGFWAELSAPAAAPKASS
jgi:diguanylate cyclase (GGDEF)-like protein/putative nucleotidyltransferase with HDIG domain